MALFFYVIISVVCLFCFTLFEDKLDDIDLDTLTDKEINWVVALFWPVSALYYIPVGLANYIKNRKD